MFALNILNHNKGTNRQQRELFIAAVRSASGDTLAVNLTIIPSAQKWVFNAIYKLAFPSLYTYNVCSMNRLVLTDEDEAEYAPFQSAILTMPEFSKSHVMLCTFHGIWQSFKKDLYPLLNQNSHGQLIGEYIFAYSSWIYSILISLRLKIYSNLIYSIFNTSIWMVLISGVDIQNFHLSSV